jgi:autotransporter-associated beta strand protein
VTLGGAGNLGNSVSGTAADLLYVASGATFNLNNTSATTRDRVNTVLGQSGNFNVAGTATITSAISDGGAGYGITKTGAGTLTLAAANTFSGGIVLNEGTLVITGDGTLGSNTVTFNGGTLNYNLGSAITGNLSNAANQDYRIAAGQGFFITTALTSSGGTFTKLGGAAISLTAANTYSGATTVGGGTLGLSGADGAIASATINLQGGSFLITNTGAGGINNDRLSDAATINLNGGTFTLGGSDQPGTSVAETVGGFVMGRTGGALATGIQLRNSLGTAGVETLTAGSLTRAGGDMVPVIYGAGLGKDATSTTSMGRFFTTTAPSLVGTTAPLATGINAAAKDTQIVPGAVGTATVTTGGIGTASILANTFLTYTAAGGYRPLNPTDEFTNDTVVAGRNTRIANATSMAASTTINSLVMANTLTLNPGTTLTNTSGMVLFAAASTLTGGTLAFGTSEGIIYSSSNFAAVIASAVTAGNGLTKAGTGTVTISGPVTLSGGGLNVGTGSFTLGGSLTVAGGTLDLNRAGIGSDALAPSANFTLTSGTINLTLGANTTPGVTFDAIIANATTPGVFTITGGTLALDVTSGAFDYAANYAVFSNFTGDNSVSGLSIIGYDTAHFEASLNNTGVLSFAAIPEPSLSAAAIGALLAAVVIRRRRKMLLTR